MATYVLLANFTQQGVETLNDLPTRIDAAKQAFREMNVNMTTLLYTMGQYDIVAILEAPDDETVTQALLTIGATGNIRTQTLRGFSEDEFRTLTHDLF